MSLKVVIPSVLGIIGSILLLLYAPKISLILFPLSVGNDVMQVGTIHSSFGGVEITPYHSSKPIRLPHRTESDTPLGNKSLVKIHRGGELQLGSPSGYKLSFSEGSEFLVELIKSTGGAGQSLQIFLFKGSFRTIKKGSMGSLFIIRDGVFSTPETPVHRAETPFEISESGDINTFFKAKQNTATNYVKKNLSAPQKAAAPDTSAGSGLSNSYLESMIAQQRKLFQKCQANSIREQKPAHGQMLVAFTIEPSGRVSETSVIKTDMTDESLKQCTMSVIKRIRFKAFSGPAFRASYPFSYQ